MARYLDYDARIVLGTGWSTFSRASINLSLPHAPWCLEKARVGAQVAAGIRVRVFIPMRVRPTPTFK